MTSNNRVVGVLTGVVAAALLVAGCAPAGEPGTDPQPSIAQLPSTGWEPADRAEVRDGGTLTLAIDQPIANFNYDNADGVTRDTDDIDDLMLPRYVNLTSDGGWEPNPDYVTSLEVTSEDPQVVEIKLNPEATWSDGTPMTVADLRGSWQAMNGKVKEFAPNSTSVWKDIESVEQGDDDRHAVLTFAATNPDWPSVLDNLTPPWLTKDPTSFNEAWKEMPYAADGKTIVSGGPFIVESHDKDAGVVTLVRNPKWWGEQPKLEKVVFRVIGRDAAGQAFVNKELDAILINASVDTLEIARQRQDGTVRASQGRVFSHVAVNGTTDAFTDVAVRRAFAQSIDRGIIAQAAIEPLGLTPETLDSLLFLPGQQGYASRAAAIAYNPDAAKAALDQAGWVPGDGGVRAKDGKPLSVRMVVPSETPSSALIAQQVQAMVAQTGFGVQIDTVPIADLFVEYINVTDRDFGASTFGRQGSAFPISELESMYTPADGAQNFPGVSDDRLPGLWTQANAELDDAERLRLAGEIDEIVVGTAGIVPLFIRPNQTAMAESLVNFGPAQFETYDWVNIGWRA